MSSLRQYVNTLSPSHRSSRSNKRRESNTSEGQTKENLENSYQEMIANNNPMNYTETLPRKKSSHQSVCFDTDGSIVYSVPHNNAVEENTVKET
mmetsp:Transcript_34344/g.67559  ORF Transcript_34344/g.67559 Transcript_34344/m.67559 type:complete len:94 (+) Transcript_34344:1469-1750(+)